MVIDYLNDFERKREWTGLKGDIKKYIILRPWFSCFWGFFIYIEFGVCGQCILCRILDKYRMCLVVL